MPPKGNKNASSRFVDDSPGPWTRWRTKDPAERCIRFMKTYVRNPKGYGHGELIKLAPFQEDWIRASLAEGVTSSVMLIGRGNGKSTLLAGMAVWALFDRGSGGPAQVPILATTIAQAQATVYGVAVEMIRAEPELLDRCIIYSGMGTMRVITPDSSQMFPKSSDPAGLQGLDPSLAIVDEVGFQPIESWDSMLLASGKRPSSLVVGIGTPGFDRDNALWHLRSLYMSGAEIPGFVYTEYAADEACDLHDEEQWRKANPALDAGFMNIDALRSAVIMSPEAHFRLFRLGQHVDGSDAWLGSDGRSVWDALKDPHDLELGAQTFVGLDVGLKKDSTALVIGQRRPDGRVQVQSKIWMPKSGEVVDPSDVMQEIRELDRKYTLVEVVYDPRLFEVPALMLRDEGIPMVEFPQSIERMSPAFSLLYEAIHNKDLHHNGDLAFTTQILNGVTRFNERGFTLAKSKSRGKIDAAYALAMMYSRISLPKKTKPTLFIG